MSAITLSDGTVIPEGAVIAFPILEHQLDGKPGTPCTDPTTFDPMRSYRMRQAPGESQLHRAGMTSPSNLSFGYGNQACPGRHFAVAEIKMIVVRLLREFDFRFLPGQTRPRVFHVDEFAATNPFAKLLIRNR
jgi:cytochrome P450